MRLKEAHAMKQFAIRCAGNLEARVQKNAHTQTSCASADRGRGGGDPREVAHSERRHTAVWLKKYCCSSAESCHAESYSFSLSNDWSKRKAYLGAHLGAQVLLQRARCRGRQVLPWHIHQRPHLQAPTGCRLLLQHEAADLFASTLTLVAFSTGRSATTLQPQLPEDASISP